MKFTQKHQERLSRPRPILFCAIVGISCSPWLILLGTDTYLRQQQVQTNLQAEVFFAQVPLHLSNPAAEQVDRIGAQLGLVPNASYAVPILVSNSAAKDFAAIEDSLNKFLLSQSSKISGPLEALPSDLANYVTAYQPIIDALQRYLINSEAPQWEMDSDRMSDPTYPPPGFFNIRSLQKLLLLSAMQSQQKGQTTEVFDTLEASWQLNKTIAERSDLSSQVLVAVISAQRASILRHLDHVPPQWQDRMRSQLSLQPIMKGVTFETWLQYRIRQNAWIPTSLAKADAGFGEKLRVMFANRFSAQSYFKLVSLNSTQTAHKALQQLAELDVCTTPQVVAEERLAEIETARWNHSSAIEPSVVTKRWQTAGMRSLSLELSLHVLQLKAQFEATGAWPTAIAPLPSEACPDERWIYTTHKDGSISLSFSQKLLSPAAIPLTYHSQQKAPP